MSSSHMNWPQAFRSFLGNLLDRSEGVFDFYGWLNMRILRIRKYQLIGWHLGSNSSGKKFKTGCLLFLGLHKCPKLALQYQFVIYMVSYFGSHMYHRSHASGQNLRLSAALYRILRSQHDDLAIQIHKSLSVLCVCEHILGWVIPNYFLRLQDERTQVSEEKQSCYWNRRWIETICVMSRANAVSEVASGVSSVHTSQQGKSNRSIRPITHPLLRLNLVPACSVW